jgi:carboxypeptidase Q
MDQKTAWGLENAYLDPFEFGRGWSHDSAVIDMISPRKVSLHGIPIAWTPGTDGLIEGEVIPFNASTEGELAAYKGQFKGKILLIGDPELIGEPDNKVFQRLNAKELSKKKKFDVSLPASHGSSYTQDDRDSSLQRHYFNVALNKFLAQEKVAGVIYRSRRQGGVLNVYGKNHRVGKSFPVPTMIIEQEHFQLLSRMIDDGKRPKVAMNIKARFHDKDRNAYNTIAEIPGTDNNPQIVMVGAHLDSWHASGGAVDNGAGVQYPWRRCEYLRL